MKDDLVERCAEGLFGVWAAYEGANGTWAEAVRGHNRGSLHYPEMHKIVELARLEARAVLAIARPAILEEAAQAIQCGCCDVCGEDPDCEFVCANKLAARVRALAHTTGQEG